MKKNYVYAWVMNSRKLVSIHLENMMNSRKEGVGITQLWRADQRPPSSGIGGRASIFDDNPNISRKVLSKVVLQSFGVE